MIIISRIYSLSRIRWMKPNQWSPDITVLFTVGCDVHRPMLCSVLGDWFYSSDKHVYTSAGLALDEQLLLRFDEIDHVHSLWLLRKCTEEVSWKEVALPSLNRCDVSSARIAIKQRIWRYRHWTKRNSLTPILIRHWVPTQSCILKICLWHKYRWWTIPYRAGRVYWPRRSLVGHQQGHLEEDPRHRIRIISWPTLED